MTKRGRRTARDESGHAQLNDISREVLERVSALMHECGLSREQIAKLAIDAVAGLGKPAPPLTDSELWCLRHASHVLTHWHTEPNFVDGAGRPRALPVTGRVSVATLAASATAQLEPLELLDFLATYGAVRKTRAGWVPTRRELLVRGNRSHQSARGLLLIRGLLRNKAHNKAAAPGGGWFERQAQNAHVPVAQRQSLYRNVEALGAQLLTHLDLDMKRREQPSLRATDKAHVCVGLYVFEDDSHVDASPDRAASAAPRGRTARRSRASLPSGR